MCATKANSLSGKRVHSDDDPDSTIDVVDTQFPADTDIPSTINEPSIISSFETPLENTTEAKTLGISEPGLILQKSYEDSLWKPPYRCHGQVDDALNLKSSIETLLSHKNSDADLFEANIFGLDVMSSTSSFDLTPSAQIDNEKPIFPLQNRQIRPSINPLGVNTTGSGNHRPSSPLVDPSRVMLQNIPEYESNHRKSDPTNTVSSHFVPPASHDSKNSLSATGHTNMPSHGPSKDVSGSIISAEETFIKLIPLINETTSANFCDLLVEVLRECLNQVPLGDFYNMIYDTNSEEFISSLTSQSCEGEESWSLVLKIRGLKICHFILLFFKDPRDNTFSFAMDAGLSPKLLCSINFHELQRTFLAIKIIFDSMIEVEFTPCKPPIPRLAVYKVYCILCQRLMLKYPNVSFPPSRKGKFLLGQSQVGKLTKLVFPKLVTKRLGRRGYSKYNYLGLAWNELMVDESILGLFDLEPSQSSNSLQILQEHNHSECEESLPMNTFAESNRLDSVAKDLRSPGAQFSSDKHCYSYVSLSSKYPDADCSPRIWDETPNCVPTQSKWSLDIMNKSVKFLKGYCVDIAPLIQNYHHSIFAGTTGNLLTATIAYAMEVLLEEPSVEKAYMHLNLAISLLVFPLILASSHEISISCHARLRNSLKRCISMIESQTHGSKLRNLTRNLRKMTHISEMIMTSVKSEYCDTVVRALISDMEMQLNCKAESSEETILKNVIIRALVLSMNAYNFLPLSEDYNTNLKDGSDILCDLANNFVGCYVSIKDALLRLLEPDENSLGIRSCEEATYQLTILLIKSFHETSLSDRDFSKLPIPVITYVILHITNEIQGINFQSFGRRQPDVSKEAFKAWWFFSSSSQEYLAVISEIVALSDLLSEEATA